MDSDTGLNARLLISTDDKIPIFQGFSAPIPRIQVEDRPGLFHELWVSRKDPVFVLPGLDRVLVQDPRQRAAADHFAQRLLRPSREVAQGLPTDRLAGFRNAFTSQGFDQCVIPRGKKRPYGRVLRRPPGKSPPPPSVFANAGLVGARSPLHGQVAFWSQSGCSCTSSTNCDRCTERYDAVLRRTSARAFSKNSSGKVGQ